MHGPRNSRLWNFSLESRQWPAGFSISEWQELADNYLRFLGYDAATYELLDNDVFQNILHPLGFAYCVSLCIRLVYTAPWPCSAPLRFSGWPVMVGARLLVMGLDQSVTWLKL